jgi:tetratricopeptide (TPR) repeat protein
LALVLAALPAYAAGAGVGTATDEQKAEAGKSYQRGAEAFAAGELEKALEEFQRSLDVVSSPNSRLMLARTLAKLGRNADAYAELERTVVDAEAAAQIDKKYATTVDAARAELAELKPQVGLVSVRVSGSTSDDSLSVGGREIEQTNWDRPVAVAPGKVRVVLRTASGEAVREVDVPAGSSASVDISPTPPPAKPAAEPPPVVEVSTSSSNTKTLGFVAGGIGLAGIASFAIFGGLNSAKFRKLEDECINSRCSPDLESERDQGKTYQTIANVSLVVGAVGIATGTVLLVIAGGEDDPQQEARTRSRAPRLGIGLGYVDVSGSF